jgi:hypothetical protein
MAAVETAEDLYGLALERFIPERTALAQALRADKRREEASQVAARRKPSVAAWAVNQLVRTQGRTIAKLFEAGDDLADAQAAAADGKRTGEQMRGAMGRQRDAIDQLVEAARGLLSLDGHPLSAQTLERVAETLRAASIDSGSREQAQSGCLVAELRFAGLSIGGLGATDAAGARRTSSGRAGSKSAQAKGKAEVTGEAETKGKPEAKEKAETKRQAKAKAKAKAKGQAKAEANAKSDLAGAQREKERRERLRQVRRRAREAGRAATHAEKELQAAEQHRDEARAVLQEAQRRLDEATATHRRASAALAEAEARAAELEDSPASHPSG